MSDCVFDSQRLSGAGVYDDQFWSGSTSAPAGRPVRRRKVLIRDRVYNDLSPEDVVAAAKEAGVELKDVREVTKERAKPVAKPKRADDEGREYWLPQEFWGRAAREQRQQATSPLPVDFWRAVEAMRVPQGHSLGAVALRQRQEAEAILLLMS